MFFNPLFISNASTGNIADGTKENKFTNSNYLFADIINVSKEKLSLTELNIEIDEKNKALFANLKSSNFPLNAKPDANTNQFVSDNENLNAFLAKVYEQINASKENVGNTEKNNSELEATVIPEQIAQIIESLNSGEKVSIPLNNNGKIAFVEIQKYDKNLISENSNKGIKLGSTSQSGIQLTDVDIKKVISDISVALNNIFSTEKFEMSDKKVKDIIAKIETSFSKLVPLKNETFQPQKNILSNLIANIENEFNLDSAASSELKKVIVAQFAKVINEKSGNSVKEVSSTDAKMDAVSSTSILKGLNLNPNEEKLIKSFNVDVVSPTELKEKIELILSESSNTSELKPILNKINNYLKNNSSQPKENATAEKFTLPEIAKELNLSPKEAAFVKSVTSEKISLPELSKELKAEVINPNAAPELKSVAIKLENYLSKEAIAKPSSTAGKITLPDVAKELNLTSSESKLVGDLEIEKLDLNELKKSIKAEIISNPNSKELKSLLNKIDSINLNSKSDLGKNQESITKETFEVKSKIVEKNNSGIKNNLNVSAEKPEIKNGKSDYIFTLKNEKSADSLAFDKIIKVETKSPELLKKSIYTSKESIELTKVKVIPINEDVARKMELKSTDDDFKRLSFKKVNTEQKVNNVNDNLKNSHSESDSSSKNSTNFSQSNIINSELNKADFSDKNFAKHVSENSQEAITKTEISKKESVGEAKTNEVKNSETSMPKTAFVENQIRNNDLRLIPKATVKQLDLKNIKEEISNLIQKGEKKSVEFQLNPENLGKMNIKLEIVNKIVSASIKVESESTQQAVQNSLEGLKTSLTQQGVQLSSLSVSLSNSEEKNNRYFKQKRKGNNPMNVKINGLEDKFAHKNLGYNNYDFIA